MARKPTTTAPEDEMPTAPPERNGPSQDDIRMAVHTMLEWNEKRAQINAAISKFRKGLKAQGITLGLLDATIKMLEWSPEEIKADFAERDWYAEAMRFPIGAQLELFGTDATPDPVKEQLRWRNIGFKDGLAGRGWPDEAPDGCPPECIQEYGRGHEEGCELVRAAFLRRQQEFRPSPPGTLEEDAEGDAPDAPTTAETDFEPEIARELEPA